MQLFDTLPTFIDDIGRPLAGGRLIIYKFNTTTLADIFVDSSYIVPANNPFSLNSAGTLPFNIYINESVTVIVQRFVGYNELNEEIYADVKEFDIIDESDSNSNTTIGYINSISDLKQYNTSNGKSVTVTGYFTSGDCPSRVFQFDESSTAIDNGGTIIESALTSNGRWIWVNEGPTVDCRTFGVISGPNNINAAFTSVMSYCSNVKKVCYIPSGSYNLTQSGSIDIHCALLVDEDVYINSSSTYTINLRNGRSLIKNSFAGSNIVLRIQEPVDISNKFEDGNPIPIEAFTNQIHSIIGNANYNIIFNNPITLDIDGSFKWNKIINNAELTLQTSGTFEANSLEGLGRITLFNSSFSPIILPEFKTSQLNESATTQSAFCSACKDRIYLDSDITLSNGTTISALIISNGTISHTGTITVSGGIEGQHNTFASEDVAVNVGFRNLDADFWLHASSLVKSFNISNTNYLDLKGGNALNTNITKGGTIENGTVGRILCNESVTLRNLTVNNTASSNLISATYVTADNVNFVGNGNINIFGTNTLGGRLSDCIVSNIGNTNMNIIASGFLMDNVSFVGTYSPNFTIKGTVGCKLYNLNNINIITIIPGDDLNLTNITIEDCYIGAVNFDATRMTNVGEAVASNISIERNKGLAGNINAINNSSKKFALNGHTNIRISNENGRKTYGFFNGLVSSYASGIANVTVNDLFTFNHSLATTNIKGSGLNISYVARKSTNPTAGMTWLGCTYYPGFYGPGPTVYTSLISYIAFPATNDLVTLHGSIYN